MGGGGDEVPGASAPGICYPFSAAPGTFSAIISSKQCAHAVADQFRGPAQAHAEPTKEVAETPGCSAANPQASNLRRGKWTSEEESYVEFIILSFNNGMLPVPAGTTLRSYLSEKLSCDPMRITKKFTGESCIGKRIFHPIQQSSENDTEVKQAQEKLLELEQAFLVKLDEQKREAERKARRGVGTKGNFSESSSDDSSSGRKKEVGPTTWVKRARKALKGSMTLAEVEKLLDEGETVCKHHGVPFGAEEEADAEDEGGHEDSDEGEISSVSSSFDKRRPLSPQDEWGVPSAAAGDVLKAACVLSDNRKRPYDSTGFFSDDQEAGGLLVGFMQSVRQQELRSILSK